MSKAAAVDERSNIQRTKSVGFRVRPQEYDELVRAADESGMPIGEWIREVALRAARTAGAASSNGDASGKLARLGLEELAAVRALVLSLFGTTNPGLTKETIDQMITYADSVKRERVDDLLRRNT